MKKLTLMLALILLSSLKVYSQIQLAVGEKYQCFIEDYANKAYDWINISWEVDYGLYEDYSGTYVKTVSFKEYKSGTYRVTAKWTETKMSDPYDPFRHKSHTWSFTCKKSGPIPVEKITLDLHTLILYNGSMQLTPTVLPNNATNKNVTWSSSNTSVATVSSSGLVSPVSAGNTTITCTAADGSGVSDKCEVTVLPVLVEKIDLNASSVSLNVGETKQLTATVTPNNATNKEVTWSSSNTDVAKISSTGLVTAKGQGSATITCTAKDGSGKIATCSVTVNGSPVTNISLFKSTTVHLNDTKKLTPTIEPSDATPTLTWTSSNSDIASVDQQGVVSGKKLGTARISVTTDNGKSAYCDIKVVKVFTGKTVEGITMTFQVLSEEDKTCQAGEDPTTKSNSSHTVTTRAIGYSTSGAVTIPSTSNGYVVKRIGGLAFINLSSITSVGIPNTVESIGVAAFQGCSNIESLVIPNSVTSIEEYALSCCSKLSTVTLPNTISILNDYLFWEDSLLTSINIPLSVEKIDRGVFDGVGLKEITIPQKVSYIGWYAFMNCYSLEKVISLIEEPYYISKNVFQNETDGETKFTNAKLYVPRGCKEMYESTDGWKNFKEIVEMEDYNPNWNDTDISKIDNVIYLNKKEGTSGSQLILSLRMKNKAPIRGFQFDLYLPDGVKADKNNKGRITASLSKVRLDDGDEHTLTVAEQSDGAIRFLCGSQYDETFSGNDGEVATITVNIDGNMKDGDYPIILKDIKLTETDISKSYETPEVLRTLTISSYMPGDINGDGKVDVSDYIGVANRIVGNTPAGFIEKAGDVDGSGTIDVSDYIGIANIILTGNIYGSSKSRVMMRSATNLDNKDNMIYVAPLSVEKVTTTANLSIGMKNSAAIRGFQFDLYLPDNVTAAKNAKGRITASLNKARLADDDEHTLTVAEQADGAIRFLCGSQYDKTFIDNDGEVATLIVNLPQDLLEGDYPIILKNIKLTETDISKYYETESLESTFTMSGTTGISTFVMDKDEAHKAIYSISGQKLENLHKGINIIGGKKVVMK